MDRRGQQGEEYLDAPPGDPQSSSRFARTVPRDCALPFRVCLANRTQTRTVRGLGQDTGTDWTWTVRGDGQSPVTVAVVDWAWTGYGHGLTLAADTDWTRPRLAGRATARTFRVQTATTSRTRKP
jgi:hypothetical protein